MKRVILNTAWRLLFSALMLARTTLAGLMWVNPLRPAFACRTGLFLRQIKCTWPGGVDRYAHQLIEAQ
jgi:hypothetical protein